MRKALAALAIMILSVAIFFAWALFTSHKRVEEAPQPDANNQSQSTETAQPTTVRIVAAGDMLPHDTINQAAKTDAGYDYKPLFNEVKNYLKADITFCNQESPSAGGSLGISGYPTFNAPEEFAKDLNAVGCNVINLANNHIADKGQDGIDKTVDLWKTINPLAFSGANRSPQEQMQPSYFTVNGVRFAFIAFTDLSNNQAIGDHSVNMFSNDLVEKLALEASKNADFVIASAHWGIEDSSTVSPSQKGWAEAMANAGVDLIIGTGPHVLQPVETITTTSGREVPVWYSLGNFLSTQLEINQLVSGVAVMDFHIKGSGLELAQLSFLPTYMHYEWTSEQAAAEDLLARRNVMLYPLANAAEPLSKSQFGTTVEAQTKYVTDILNTSTKIKIINPSEF